MGIEEVNISAGEIGKEIGKNLVSNMPPEVAAGFAKLVTVLEAISIVVLIYIIVLIIKAFFSILTNRRIKKISENVEEINNKLDSLVKKKTPRASKK